MLPSDRDFGLIENKVRRCIQYVFTPDHWREITKSTSQNLVVYEMTQQHFVKFDCLQAAFVKRTKTDDGTSLRFRDVARFRYESSEPWKMSTSVLYKVDYWESISLAKKGRQYKKEQSFSFVRKYTKPRPIDRIKYTDLMSLKEFIPNVYHNFYANLKRDAHGLKTQVEMLDLDSPEAKCKKVP